MQIQFTGHHVNLSKTLKKYTVEKFDRLNRHFKRITAINVIFDVEKLRKTVEANILISKKAVHASAQKPNFYEAIDCLADKLDRQLIKHKEKNHTHRS